MADWTPVPTTSPLEIARLPFPDSQRLLQSGVTEQSFRCTCAWHGTALDADTGAFGIVRSGSALEPLVGEVARVTLHEGVRPRVVYVYLKAALDLPYDDLSLTRRAFLALSYPSRDQLKVEVEPAVQAVQVTT